MADIFELLKSIRQPAAPTGPVQWLVVGLGNPEKKYDCTRHNIGFAAVDRLAEQLGVRVDRLRFKALCGDAVIAGQRVLLMKPTTYMNLSGQAVQEALAFHKLPVEHILVLSDDVSLDVGRLRVRAKGSDGGHNGLKSIIYLTGKDSFPRIRIGVGKKPHPDYDLADWVLGRFSDEERKTLLPLLDKILPACELIIKGELQEAMNRYNAEKPVGKATERPAAQPKEPT